MTKSLEEHAGLCLAKMENRQLGLSYSCWKAHWFNMTRQIIGSSTGPVWFDKQNRPENDIQQKADLIKIGQKRAASLPGIMMLGL